MRQKIDGLLAAHGRSGDIFDRPEIQAAIACESMTERIGTQIGLYTIREQIGEGGMGVVYVAEQAESIRRKVVLKIIKPGMDTKQVIARFEAERQTLALLDHPHIAKILDAGTTGDDPQASRGASAPGSDHPEAYASGSPGRPYFVIELVRGVPITEFCDAQQLNLRQRLELFTTVCRAVQHAHQKGIIHRDLKPGNVLVELHDVTPVPKVIDFGIAKATNQQLAQQTVYTQFSQLVGTPLYMSPEQAQLSGIDIDTRSDVNSLGVLLYELLTGVTPFDDSTLKEAGFDEMRRIIREDEPPRPSERVSTLQAAKTSTLSGNQSSDPRRLQSQLQRELDWIVMKALEKDRDRRYESASAFAADTERYLKDEPVEACPPSTAYRLRKFARRNKAVLTTTILVALTLFVGTTVSIWQAYRASNAERLAEDRLLLANQRLKMEKRARRDADEQRQRAEKNLRVATESIGTIVSRFGPIRPQNAVTAISLELAGRLDPKGSPDAFKSIGNLYVHLMHYSEALGAFGEGLKIDPQNSNSFVCRGDVFYRQGRETVVRQSR